MTWGDLYVTVTLLSFVGLVAVGCGWAYERWIERRQRADALIRFRRSPEFRDFEAAMRRVQTSCGTALVGPASRMADALRGLAERIPAPAGTVQNPSDPSPRPRSRRG